MSVPALTKDQAVATALSKKQESGASAVAVQSSAIVDDTSLENLSFAELQALGQKGSTNDKSGTEIQAEHPELFDNARLKKLQHTMDEEALGNQKAMAKIAAKEILTKRLRARAKCRTPQERLDQQHAEKKEQLTMNNMFEKLADMGGPNTREKLTKALGAKQAEQHMQQIKNIRQATKAQAKEKSNDVPVAATPTERQQKKSKRNAKRKAEKKATSATAASVAATATEEIPTIDLFAS